MNNRKRNSLLATAGVLFALALLAFGFTGAAVCSLSLVAVATAIGQFGMQSATAILMVVALGFPMATLLVNGGRAIITNLLSGIGGTVPKYVAWGTGAGTTGATDTTLFTESAEARTSGTVTRTTTSTTNDSMQVVGAITATAGRTITNMGLFDASTSGNLFFKTDFTGIVIASGDSIQFTVTVSFS